MDLFYTGRIIRIISLPALLLLVVAVLSATVVRAQLVVDESTSNAEGVALIEDVFLGSCVSVSNVEYRSSYNRAVGEFSNGNTTNIGLDGGIIMTSGRANLAIGPNDTKCAERQNGGPSDPDLAAIASAGINDRTVLEFDFIPQNDTLTFEYVFSSEEYHEWVDAGFNDAFGFFISGPGIAGPYTGGAENIALIPTTTTPVTIDNVNNGQQGPTGCGGAANASTGPCDNCAYFVDNTGGTTIQYDAFTTVLTATAVVTPCETYHIKLAVGDAGDQRYDSGVFLKGGSFSAGGGVTVELETTTTPPGIYEGCNDAWFVFRRVDGSDNTNPITADFDITGTATPGVDYTAFPSDITIPAGQDTVALNVSVFLDFITEGSETITITLDDPPCACEAPGSATIDILDNDIPLAISTTGTTTICLGQSADLEADPTGSQTPYTGSWDNGAPAGEDVTVSPTNTTTYTYTLTDACGGQTVTSSETITVIRPDFTVDDDEQCLDGNSFNFTNTGATGGSVTHLWEFGDGNDSNLENPTHTYAADGDFTVTHYIIFTASNCTADASAVITVFPEPEITATVDQNVICAGGTDGVISTSVTGGTAGFDYAWSPGGQTTSSITGQGVGPYTVTVTDANGCTDSDSETIIQNDPVDPTAVCQDITVQLDGSGNATISATDVDNGSSDNCGIASLVVSPNAFTCAELGANSVTLTVTDVNGNTDDCTATVTVEDNVDPVAVCQDITVQLNASGNTSIVAADVDGGSTDNCSVTVSATPLSFTCANVGANNVTLTATDGSGNTDDCVAVVTVEDNVDPTAICQDVTLSLDGSGNLIVQPTDIDNGSNDACGLSGMFANPAVFDCDDTGTNSVTLTVTDNNGNQSTCTSTVTVVDDENPTALCQDITVQLDASGNATITVNDVDNGSNDNCSVTLSATPLAFDCSDAGSNTVTLTATDPSSNTDNCTATVTIEDTVDPTAACQDITVQLDASGNASIVASDVDDGSNDNCSVTLSASPLSFDCSDVGANTVTLTATDPSSNTDDCTATVTIEDTVDPTAICQDITVQLDASGNATITANDVDNGSNDNCSVTLSATPLSFTCANAGANTVTLTATDPSGNTDDCTATVTIEDDIDPTAICQDITVQLDASGNATITANDVDNGSNDNCSVTLSATPLSFDCSNTGANTVTLTATDPSGNTDNCTATVTIEDSVDPTAICQDITVQLDATGNAAITANDVDSGSNDNCSVTLSATPLSFTCANTGANTVTLTATDPSGNTDDCTATVTIEDSIDPTAICQNIIVQLDASGNASITANDVDNGSNDNCSVTLSATPLTFDCTNTGANTVTLTATDPSGNTDDCTVTVTIEDDVDPTASCNDITVQLDGSGSASIVAADIDGGSTDNCSGFTVSPSPNTFTCADLGVNTVTLTVTDASGNVSTCTSDITIEDNVDPTAVCQDITVYLDGAGNASITSGDVDGGSTDNCSVTVSATPLSFTCADVGANSVTLTATDQSSNTDNCTATVTVQDTVSPTAVCQDITIQLDATGNAAISATDVDNGSTDNCAVASLMVSPNTFTCSEVGANTVTLTVTDVNGNASTCASTVTVEDDIDPTTVCQDITVQLDANGDLTIVSADIDGGSSDNCGIASLTIDGGNTSQDFDCSDVGVNTVTLTVTDVNGNVSTCDATVTVEDNVDPSAVCQDITVQLDANGDLTITSADVDGGSSDACGIASLTIDGGNTSQDFDCSSVGTNTVTLAVTDVNGNVSTCDATVTVEDTVDPTAVCQDITVQLDGNGDLTITSADIDGGSTDNCGIASLEIDGGNTTQDFDCSSVGTNTVTLTVTDVNGNVSTCDATVTIEDNIDPSAVCQNVTIQLDASGNASVSTVDIDNGSNDNCGIASITLDGGASSLDFDCSDVGVQTVTLTVTDVNSNVSTCTADVTIEDNVDPSAVCQNITVQLDANGDLTITSADVNGGSTDACGIASLTIDGGNTSQDFDCSNVGTNTVTLTVTDVNGNVSTCTADVTIEDNIDPTAVCQDITIQLDASGNASVATTDIDNGSSDNCGIASITLDGASSSLDFDCSDVGVQTVTLTVTDVNGNVSTCTADVTVEDNIDPTAVCQDITVQLDASGNAVVTTVDIDNGSNDNCGIASITLDGGASSLNFDCSDEGANTVTLTVTDVNGNVSTCTATVTVENNIIPTVSCQDITIYLDATGNVSIVPADVDGGSNAACGIASLTTDQDAFTCANVGANTVTLTGTDNSGNVSTCTSTVTVLDTISPDAVCQDITVQLDANGDLTISSADIDGGSADNCAVATLTIDGGNTTQDFDCSNVGANTVTLTVTDVNGNVSTCDAAVTVEDNVDPSAVCQDITVQLDANGDLTITSADIDNGSSDACGIASLEIDGGNTSQDFDCSTVGANMVTLTVTDVNGNISTCDATVTVEDTVDPTAICQDITVQLDANGEASISTADIDNGSSDNCGIASITLDGGSASLDFDCSDVGVQTVTLTVTDVNGNASTCTADVTVEDNIDPTALCQNITVQLDATGNASIATTDIDNGSSDACGIASITLDGGAASLDFDCSDVGVQTVTLTVTDVNGNISTCTADVTIEDTVDPTALCQNITVQLDSNGELTIASTDIDGGSADNCGIASLTIDGGNTSQDFDCSTVGANTVTLSVTDLNGNISTCDATVTVEDTISPSAICQDITVQLDANGELTLLSADIDGGSADNCGIASVTVDGGNTSQDFDCSSVGSNTITLTVTDVNGNVSSCDATVTIEDSVNPTAVCQDVTVQLDATGNLTIASVDIDGGSNDNCGIASLEIDGGNTSQDFDCSNVGANTVTLTVTDVNGNVSTCDATVTIEDVIDPTAICQDLTVQLDANGDATVSTIDIDNGSSDNCGIATITLDGGAASLDFDCSDVGVQTVTLTVTDVNGNISTCTANVTVEDNVDPTALCQNITVQLDATGNATITGGDIDNGSADNCGVTTLDVSVGTFDCSNVGTQTVTLTVTDNNGNNSTCIADVTVEDNVDPTALCQDITVYSDANGDVTIVAADVDGGSTDNCTVDNLSINDDAFDCNDLGTNVVTLTVTDVNGNVSTCTSTVTVEDTIAPTPVCIDIIAELDPTGNVTVAPGDVDNGSFDNCAIVDIALDPNTFTCAEVGFNTVTLTVEDIAGNTSTCTAQVDVQDNVLPGAVCQDITVQLDGAGNATITPVMVDNGSSDACGAITPTIVSPSAFDCSNVGVNIVTLTVEDQNGNISTCASTVTIQDTVNPIAVCQDITVQLDATGNASIVPADVDGGSSDNCAIDNLTVSPNSFTCAEEGANTVTLTVTDVNGNVSTCDATVTVENNVIPTVSCQDITVYLDAAGNASITASDVDGGSNAACGIASLTVDPSTFTCAEVGANTVTLTGTDNSGNVSTCTATVTVEDTVSPAAVCQDITIQLDAAGNASIAAADIDNGSSDNCSVATLVASQTGFACAEVGTNTVTLTVTDVNGNVSTCDATVTVEDDIDPTIVCQDITVQLDASGNVSITGADIDNGTGDNCSTVGSTLTLDVTPSDFDCNNVGSNTVTLTATDENGNSSSCMADVTVQDNEAPIALCQDITIYLDAAGNVAIAPADIDNGSSDNCAIDNMVVSPNSFTCSGVGANPVTLTVTDVNANVASCIATVTVIDTISPTATCQNITVQVDAGGNASIVPSQVNNGSNDACGIASLTVDVSTFDCSVVGGNTVELTVTDNNGNVSTCTSTVTVEDNVDPNAVCQNVTVQLDANGDASIVAADVENGSTDNCAIASYDVTPNTFDCSNVGTNTVTLTVTDVNGNTDNCSSTVTVQDTIDPTAVCQDITVQLDASGELTIASADIDGGSNDNCGIASLEIDGGNTFQDFDCSSVGTNTVTLTVTDVNGNISTCDATVTVEDTISPTAICQDITVQLDANGELTIASADIDGGSNDNCGIASLEIDNGNTSQDFDCSSIGTNTITLTVTDANGNISTCDATVTVQDTVTPVIVCQDITVQLDANGEAAITGVDLDGGTTDNCGLPVDITYTSSVTDFDCSNVGVNTITLTATDQNGNVSTCSADVTVEDNVDPTAVCQDITVQLDATGNVSIVAADVDGGSSDNCGLDNLAVSQDAFVCAEVGANTVTLTVTDVNGNISTCDATVTVEDTISPSAVCQDITVQLDANGELTIVSADIDGGSNDNCGIASMEIDNGNTTQDFDCSQVGTNTATLTVTDVNGNASTCDAIVTVEDTISPNAVCQDITVQLDANGELTITSADIDGGSNDNCGIASLEIDGGNTSQGFDCSSVGVNTVTLTVTDVNGNISTCDATVTVEDTISPSAICQDITVQLDANGELTIASADIDGGSNDNCGIASLEIDGGNTTQDFDCSNVGTNTVTLTVTDVNGNVSTCDATVTVEDTISPTIVCQDITIELDATGTVVLTAVELDGGTTDNCGSVTFDIDASNTAWTCADVGVQTVTLTATDANGNASTCDAQVTIENNVVPTVSCQDITVYLDATGNIGIDAEDVNGGSNASCGLASLTVTPDAFDCSNIGANTVTLTATDSTGNETTCNATVTVLDTISPTAICNNITVDLDANGDVIIDAADLDGGSSDNCAVASVTVDSGQLNTDLDCSTVGQNTVTVTVTDVNGNETTCDATVTVEDNTNPTAVCDDITVQLNGNGETIITPILVDNGSNDNCGIDSLSVLPTSLDCNNIGTNSIVLTVYDVNGNISTCVATVTAQDTVAPTAICQDITVQLTSNGTAVIAAGDIDDGSFDNCGIQSLSIDNTSFDCSNIGSNTVELTVTDVNGNVSTCTSTANVVDEVDPNVICQNISVYLDANGEVTIAAADVDGGSTDACGISNLSVNTDVFDCSNVGLNAVTLTVTDNYGNSDVCQAEVEVIDTVPPVASCTPVVVQLDGDGLAVITPEQIDLNSTDNCAVDLLQLDQNQFDCTEIGSNTVTLTVTDLYGNSSTCTAEVIVEDNVAPVSLCQDHTVYLDAFGNVDIASSDIDNGSSDNCAIDTMIVTPDNFTCSGVGENPVVLTVTDVNGNVSSCNATVTVFDTISPVTICQDITVQLNADGNASIVAEEIDNGSNDACGVLQFTVDVTQFDCSDVGANPVTLTVEDNNGNTSTCSASVLVEDNVNPVANCLDLEVVLNGNGMVNVSAGEMDGGSTDNCAIDSIYASQTDFTCSDLGENFVTLTVLDVNGNTATCISELTVVDTLAPVIMGCPADTVIVPDSSDCEPQVFWVEPTADDNCTVTLTADHAPGDEFPVGTTTVTYTAIDQSNNSTTCTFDVTIEPSPLVVQLSSPVGPCGENVSCNGAADAQAVAAVSGGCLPYSYLWSDGQTTQTATGLAAGTYSVIVSDANGTTAQTTITITEPEPLATDSLASPQFVGGANVSCAGASDGAIDINVVGGQECEPYVFEWTGPNGFTSTDEDLSALEAGTYVVTVTDVNGCSHMDSITLSEPAPVQVEEVLSDYNGFNISCAGAADGSIDLEVSGGAGPYTYQWNNGETTQDIDSLSVGIYTYTVTDANGCTFSGSLTLTEPDGLSSSIAISDYNGFGVNCFGSSDGDIDLTVSDGTPGYSYEWSTQNGSPSADGATTEDLTELEAGVYTITVTDANGCQLTDSVELTQPDELAVNPQDTTLVSCNGAEDGSFFVQAEGGVPTYVYSWSDGQMGPTAEEIGAGTYTVTVTDLNGCQDSIELIMTEPIELAVSIAEVIDVTCFGEENGVIDVDVSGGTAPYDHQWNNGETTQDLVGFPADTYALTVTDANGCEDTITATIGQPDLLILDTDTVINATCSGASDGSATVAAAGGTQPYIYTWPTLNQSGASVSGLDAGTYPAQVTDANGCTASTVVVVAQPASIQAQVEVLQQVSCNGLEDASAQVVVSGGTEPYSYLWPDNTTDSVADGLGAGSHSVTVTDANGCDTTLVFDITQPDSLILEADTVANVSCNGLEDGEATVLATGGTEPYSYSWSSAAQGATANGLAAGQYNAYVEDTNGCSDSLSVTITEPDTLELLQEVVVDVSCFGGNDGEATVLLQGGTAPISVSWPLLGEISTTVTGLEAGSYTYLASDANNCLLGGTIIIEQPDQVVAQASVDTVICPGSDVVISATASGGAGNYSFDWDNGLGFGATHSVSPSETTTYVVQVFDQSGCPGATDSVTVTVAESPEAAFTSSAATPCVLPADIQMENLSSGAVSYTWNFGNGTQSSEENPAATYTAPGTYTVTLTATSAEGCTDQVTGTVNVADVPVVDFDLTNSDGCAPLVVNFGNNSSPGLDYFWDFGDGNTSNLANPSHVYQVPGSYDVSLIVSSPSGCVDTLTATAGVTAYPSPIADFTPNSVDFPEPGSTYEFINNSTGAELYNWNFGNGEQSDEFEPTYDYPQYGGYFVTLTAINEFGCADTAVHYVNVDLQTELFVPNALSIGAVGEGSLFLPKGVGLEDYHVWVFDEWGNLLWESTALNGGSPAEGWDGRYKGAFVPQGSYVWKINAVFVNGEVWEGMEYPNGKFKNTGTIMVIH